MSLPTPQPISAAHAIGELLKSPDDLLKIAALRKRLEKEKASINVKLKSGVKDQLEATREGLRKLMGTRNNVQSVKDDMANVHFLCQDPGARAGEFEQISWMSVIHRNFALTEEMVSNLSEMYTKLATLESQLSAARDDPLGPSPHLLPMHYQITQLEAFRNQTLHQAKRANSDARKTLARYFERLNGTIDAFDDYLMLLARSVLGLVRAGQPAVVVKLIKIAEVEGREDEKALAIRLVKKMAKIDAAAKFKSMQANARVIKNYRSKIFTQISASIQESFTAAYMQDRDAPGAFLDNLQWMYQDLVRIQDDVVPLFPADYEIFAYYVKAYHKSLNSVLVEILETGPEASVLLQLHAWVKDYKTNMKELSIPQELITPPLLDGKEQGLIDDYLKLIIGKMDEWSNNLMRTEIRDFSTREQPPEVDSDGLYGMQGAVIMFQMVNQQADLAADSGQGSVLASVVGESSRVMRRTQEQWVKLVDLEFKKQTDKPDEVPPGLGEYIIALANDQIKCADFAEALSARLEPLVSEKYKVIISDRLNEAMDGYLDVAKKSTQMIIDLIMHDLRPATKALFTTTWYGGVMTQIVETMRDYMNDYQPYLNPFILDLLVDDLLDTFLMTYLTALRRCSKLQMPMAADRIRDDISEVFSLFSVFKQPKELETNFEIIELILAMLTASKKLVFLDFWNFAKKHGPNLGFVEAIMRARDDLTRSDVSEVMESIKRKVKEEKLGEPAEPTIMNRITGQSAFANIQNVVANLRV
ncbi:exocyst complex component Sec6 [Dacryopinax primogenitus]|uniref:Exocyst complex component Sec6 n=1 Tax=Dacryopinax primogenitus (strain DJM 731) TaxID=1858805 RepID=M5G678_DACPD|nr:exocyst complex component Sec6 [Dacryopinax primogenitus]EJU03705.1 exocyst complex component Sec6 [Dacryopinax primogenitus]